MFNPDFNPYDALEQLQLSRMSHETNIEQLNGQQQELAKLLEMLAEQVKHLSKAMAGLQAQNMILHSRLERLEESHD
jgi:uncharacterized protein YukE